MLIVLAVRRDDGEFVSEIVITSLIIHITDCYSVTHHLIPRHNTLQKDCRTVKGVLEQNERLILARC